MTVLAAVLPDARRIIGDAARIRLRVLVERLLEQEHAIGPLDALKTPLQGREGPLVVARSRIGRPPRRHRITHRHDLAVVGEIERVMIAEPADLQGLPLRRQGVFAANGEGLVPLLSRDRYEPRQNVGEEESHPDARALPLAPKSVDAVVPIACAQQRQAVLAHVLERVFDREPRMLVDRRRLSRNARDDDPGVLVLGDRRPFEERRRLVEHRRVALLAHVASEHIREPQVRIGRLGALPESRAAVGRPCHHLSTSPSRNCWLACRTICWRVRRGSRRIKGSTSCN